MRGHNFIKLAKAIDLLSKPQGVTVEELARGLRVDRRSVHRWIETIQG